jgi:hypothetical protein
MRFLVAASMLVLLAGSALAQDEHVPKYREARKRARNRFGPIRPPKAPIRNRSVTSPTRAQPIPGAWHAAPTRRRPQPSRTPQPSRPSQRPRPALPIIKGALQESACRR